LSIVFTRGRLLSVVVSNGAGGRAVGRPTLHGGPVPLIPIRVTHRFFMQAYYNI